jgi:hypothetical protein
MPMGGFITIEDGEGRTSTMQLNHAADTVLETGDALDAVEAVAAAILPYIEGRITQLGVTVLGTLPAGNPAAPDPDANAQEKALFPYEVTGGFKGRISVPTINKEAAFRDNSSEVTDAFQAAMEAVVEDALTDERGAVIVDLERGYQTYANRKRRV